MHAVCGYPIKSTWIKEIKAGNYLGWPMLNDLKVNKYYPKTKETTKVHMNQTQKKCAIDKDKSNPTGGTKHNDAVIQ